MIKLLVIDDIVPKSKIGYGYPRALNLYNTLSTRGFNLTLLPINARNTNETKTSSEFSQKINVVSLFSKKELFSWLEKYINQYDALFVSRPKNLKSILPFLNSLTNKPKIIYDAEALNSLREISRLKLANTNTTTTEYNLLINEEIKLISNADLISCVSHYEMKLIQEHLNKKTFLFSHYHKTKITTNDFKSRKGILFVGGFYSTPCPNTDALTFFFENIFPIIIDKLNVSFTIVGHNANVLKNTIVPNYLNKNVRIINNVKSLYKYYNECRITVIPTRIGAGISYKFTETLSYGTPTVTTKLIANQISPNYSLDGFDSPEEFAEAVIKLYTDEILWTNTRNKSLSIIENYYSKSILIDQIDKLFTHLKK